MQWIYVNNKKCVSITVAVAVGTIFIVICTTLIVTFFLSRMNFLHRSSTHRCHLTSKSILIRVRNIIV
jgi:hypothetical protein